MKKIIIANWKMNLNNAKAIQFAKTLNIEKIHGNVVIAAPFIFLPALSVLKNKFKLSAQNVSDMPEGAYTGEVSAQMLKEIGVKYSLVGHSERRIYFNEDNFHINMKIKILLKSNITPILCFGENANEKKSGKTQKVIMTQLNQCLKGIPVKKIVLAYEPVWAISTFQKDKVKKSASLDDVKNIFEYIRSSLIMKFGKNGGKIPILYGGSVNEKNAVELLNIKNVDGLLVGSASLNVINFLKIIKSI